MHAHRHAALFDQKAAQVLQVGAALPRLRRRVEVVHHARHQVQPAHGSAVAPLVQLERLAVEDDVMCGLVTGNVEGIARKKMRAVGIMQTGALSPPSLEQGAQYWGDEEADGFLGGFGSDYCSGRIDDVVAVP